MNLLTIGSTHSSRSDGVKKAKRDFVNFITQCKSNFNKIHGTKTKLLLIIDSDLYYYDLIYIILAGPEPCWRLAKQYIKYYY